MSIYFRNQVVPFSIIVIFAYLLFLELLPNSKKIKKLKTVLAELQGPVSFKDLFQDFDNEDSEAMIGYRFVIFSVEDKKEIVQLLKDLLIKNNALSPDQLRLMNSNDWFSLFEDVTSKHFTDFLNKYIPSYVNNFPKPMINVI